MQRGFALVISCFVASAVLVEGATKASIAPKLQPESSKKFFGKDYPADERPKVDVLHFQHPYPVIQDSEDFDKDFVKDENSDNGQYKAQSEYDRLRHKLAQLKKEAEEAKLKKVEEKKELDDAEAKYQAEMAKDKAAIAKKDDDVKPTLSPVKAETPKKPVKQEPVVKKASWWPFSWGEAFETKTETPKKKEAPGGTAKKATKEESAKVIVGAPKKESPTKAPKKMWPVLEPIDPSDAKEAVEKAMKNLEKCQDELAEAKAELKKLMEELEKAKLEQQEAAKKLEQAEIKYKAAAKLEKTLHSKYSKEEEEWSQAKAAYLKQKALVEKLKAQLQAAGEKVEAMRAAEDKDGGVYPTAKKSGASSASAALAFAVVAGWHMA